MVPESYNAYFTAGASAAAALVGLLFVAISLRPETIFGPKAPPGGRALAGSTFTSLVNAFFLSIMALLPGISLGAPAAIVGVICIVQTLRLHRRLFRSEPHPFLLALSLASFGGEILVGVLFALSPSNREYLDVLTYLLIGSFSVALSRAWALMEGRHVLPAEAGAVEPDPDPEGG